MNNLREIRKSKDLTIRKLSQLTGTSISSLSRIETGEISPKQDVMCKIAEGLGVDVCEIFQCRKLSEMLKTNKKVVVEAEEDIEMDEVAETFKEYCKK